MENWLHGSISKLRFSVLYAGTKEQNRMMYRYKGPYTGPVSVDVFVLNSSLEFALSLPLFPFPLVTEWLHV
jgi:hypothetical protein